jgi:hypothetical protein
VWREQTMVVSGGLGQEVLPLRDIWYFSLEEEKWSKLHVNGMLPRYSHTSAVCGDQLILIGGVNTLPGNQPGVCVIDLNTASCTEYALPVSERELRIFLLFLLGTHFVSPVWWKLEYLKKRASLQFISMNISSKFPEQTFMKMC